MIQTFVSLGIPDASQPHRRLVLFKVRRGDTILALTDPPLLSVVAGVVAAVKRARLVNWCQDLFSDYTTAARLGAPWATLLLSD